ncbi:MAG: Rrf2 family transcriptional regulator [Catenisphaera adipataccumulans]|jgi:DNA-binding IscR family transcriptional regulator|uniref:Rrf2 family transcriptional regulator n=1 Tax=Catenisphaera adipataccumulans TaxID=700500 RepID=UPI003D8CBEC3
MQVSTKFTIAIHLLAAVKFFEKDYKITSAFLASSIGSNPVIVRNIMINLQDAGLIKVKRGPGGITLCRSLDDITFLDVYEAVETNGKNEMFHFHENPSPQCPVGKNIHRALDGQLAELDQDFRNDLAGRTVQEVLNVIQNAQSETAEKQM